MGFHEEIELAQIREDYGYTEGTLRDREHKNQFAMDNFERVLNIAIILCDEVERLEKIKTPKEKEERVELTLEDQILYGEDFEMDEATATINFTKYGM